MKVIDFLKEKAKEGYCVGVECKAKGRGYELTYEADLTKKSSSPGDLFGLATLQFAVGDTLEECIGSLFGVELEPGEADERLKAYMNERWNIDISFSESEGGFQIRGAAKQIQERYESEEDFKREKESIRFGLAHSIDELMEKMFVSYDKSDSYVQEMHKQMELLLGER